MLLDYSGIFVAFACKVSYTFIEKPADLEATMKHRPRPEEQDDLLRPRLVDMIDMRHELVKLAELIDWQFFETDWAGFFPSTTGRPATSPRLAAGLSAINGKPAQRRDRFCPRKSWRNRVSGRHAFGHVFGN